MGSIPHSLQAKLYERPASWIALGLVCLAIDYVAGPLIQFPLFYLAPVSLASWYGGRGWGFSLAVCLSLARIYFNTIWITPLTVVEVWINAGIRVTVFVAFAWLIDRAAGQLRDLRHTRLLEGMLGVCSVCKKIRDEEEGEWSPLDAYVSKHPEEFRRSVCPTCTAVHDDVFDRR